MKTHSAPDGGGFNMYAMWWRVRTPFVGCTWFLCDYTDADNEGGCVVDDFGNLVKVPDAH